VRHDEVSEQREVRKMEEKEERKAVRLKAAKEHARGLGLPTTLTLEQWLVIIDDSRGTCALCAMRTFESLDMWDHSKGVTLQNAVPVCKSCLVHETQGWSAAIARVINYLKTPARDRDVAVKECDLLRLVERID
jgi:hypothetical protein